MNLVQFDPANPTIGLFGTCDRSVWRKQFIARYSEVGASFYNPQLGPGEWDENTSPAVEAEHLNGDPIIVFAVTWESASLGSLAETGFSVLQVVHDIMDTPRDCILFMSMSVDSAMVGDPVKEAESIKARKLVAAHLDKLRLPNLWRPLTLGDTLALSLELRQLHIERYRLRQRYGS